MKITLDDVDTLEAMINRTLDGYNNIRDTLQTLWYADCMRGVDEITYDDWDRITGVLAGVLRMFRAVEAGHGTIDDALKPIFDAANEAQEAEENEYKGETGNDTIITLQTDGR